MVNPKEMSCREKEEKISYLKRSNWFYLGLKFHYFSRYFKKRKVHKHQTKETLDLFLPYEVYSETEYISIMLTANLEL